MVKDISKERAMVELRGQSNSKSIIVQDANAENLYEHLLKKCKYWKVESSVIQRPKKITVSVYRMTSNRRSSYYKSFSIYGVDVMDAVSPIAYIVDSY